ncbi:MAG: S-layer homology domain-containing protein, partial [Bacillota bacterium]|nr:S-layer homology domain-containing protein [Bacillota bacterium]
MKTLKKVLAVVLALAMVLGMTSMASAAFAGETINADYQEAVDVLNAIGVLTGKGDGKFDPQGTLTRAEGATIITKLLGQANFAGKAEYSDAANHWGSSAIAYVAYAGIADGIGANKFNPDGVLTGNAFAKWLAAAIGYNVKLEGM